jgi:hypothetical protein
VLFMKGGPQARSLQGRGELREQPHTTRTRR